MGTGSHRPSTVTLAAHAPRVNKEGPKYGYFTNASKTWLVSKVHYLSSTAAAFTVKVTSEGRPNLGAALSKEEYIQAFVTDKVQQWTGELEHWTPLHVPNPMLLMQHLLMG